jgi:hypothetical protein
MQPAPRPTRLLATVDPHEAEIRQDAKEFLRRMRSGEGDPFDADAPHEWTRAYYKAIAASGERNPTFVADAARAGMADAHEALADLISERNSRGEPPGMALGSYIDSVFNRGGPAPVRLPEGRTQENFVADLAVVFLLIYLQRKHGLKLRRNPASKHPSACSIAADVLREAGVWAWGGEERVRKVWERHGPPAIPTYRDRLPPPGVKRFIFA